MAAGIADERCLAFAVVRCSGAVWPARICKQKAGQRSIWTIRKADDGQFGGKSMMPINALQRTRPSRFGCNSRVPWAGSLVRRAERMVLGDFEQKETKRTKGRP